MISSEVAVLLGAAIGGSISIITNWLRQRSESRRELKRLAFEMAIKEYDRVYENLKNTGGRQEPLEVYITYYLKYIELSRNGKIELENIKKLRKFRVELSEFYLKELRQGT